MTKSSAVLCKFCHQGHLFPIVEVRKFKPNGEVVTVDLLRSECDHCDCVTTLSSQHTENLKRLAARKADYGNQLLGEEFFAFRRYYGLTLDHCAELFGITKRAYASYEAEKSRPRGPARVLIQLAIDKPFIVKELGILAGVEIPMWESRMGGVQS